MKKLSYILLAGLTLVAAAACNKQLTPADEPEVNTGVPMTLTATIGGPDTKLGFTKDGYVLKGTWNANEEVSVITINGAYVETIDKFSSGSESDGKTTANFSGTFTGDASHTIVVVYPALENYDGSFYGTSMPAGMTNDGYRMISGFNNIGSYTLSMNNSTQSANGNTDHLGAFSFLKGEGTVSGTDLTVNLVPQVSVLQVNISFDSSLKGKTFGCLDGEMKDASAAKYLFNANGSQNINIEDLLEICDGTIQLYLGSWSGTTQTPITLTDSDLSFVAYVPISIGSGAHIGGTGGAASIEFDPCIDGTYGGYKKTVSLTADMDLEAGKVYRVNVSIP
ncbi:MAG: hypothetical protein IKO29_00905 [Bacteroidales bacterium]|nr:hypothetical protein [Bacteroidales bacterium]